MWVKGNLKPKKLDRYQKMKISNEGVAFVEKSEKLSKSVNRIEVKSGRVYLYHLFEQHGWNDADVKFIKPLVDGKYLEFPYARITIYNYECSLDWQQHNNKWVSLFKGTLQECLRFMDETEGWFE